MEANSVSSLSIVFRPLTGQVGSFGRTGDMICSFFHWSGIFFGRLTFQSSFQSRTRDSTPCHVGRQVGPSIRPSVTFLNSGRFSHYCSCPTIRDWIAVYPALKDFSSISKEFLKLIFPLQSRKKKSKGAFRVSSSPI